MLVHCPDFGTLCQHCSVVYTTLSEHCHHKHALYCTDLETLQHCGVHVSEHCQLAVHNYDKKVVKQADVALLTKYYKSHSYSLHDD